MNIKEAVEYLRARDYRCSASTVRKLVKAGKIPCYRPGVSGRGRMEFTPARLDAFLRSAEIGVGGVSPAETPPQPKAAPKPRAPKPSPPAAPKPPDWRDRMAKVLGS